MTEAGFLHWLEGSMLGHAMRSSGVWSYGIVNLVHIVGISVLFGTILLLDLRLLGLWRQMPLAVLSSATVTMARIGFGLAFLSGVAMLATKASEYGGNPFLYVKFPAIALALVNVAAVHRSSAWRAHKVRALLPGESRALARMAALSLFFWSVALGAGRMIAYW